MASPKNQYPFQLGVEISPESGFSEARRGRGWGKKVNTTCNVGNQPRLSQRLYRIGSRLLLINRLRGTPYNSQLGMERESYLGLVSLEGHFTFQCCLERPVHRGCRANSYIGTKRTPLNDSQLDQVLIKVYKDPKFYSTKVEDRILSLQNHENSAYLDLPLFKVRDSSCSDRRYRVAPLYNMGTLKEKINQTTQIINSHIINTVWQILKGMAYLFQKYPNMVHGGLKTNKIFVHNNTCKIGALEEIKWNLQGEQTEANYYQFDPLYTAPEIIVQQQRIPTSAGDIFSLGVVLFQVVFRSHPFLTALSRLNRESPSQAPARLQQCLSNLILSIRRDFSMPFKQSEPMGKFAMKMIPKMLSPDPISRPTFQEVYEQFGLLVGLNLHRVTNHPRTPKNALNHPRNRIPEEQLESNYNFSVFLSEEEPEPLTVTSNGPFLQKCSEILFRVHKRTVQLFGTLNQQHHLEISFGVLLSEFGSIYQGDHTVENQVKMHDLLGAISFKARKIIEKMEQQTALNNLDIVLDLLRCHCILMVGETGLESGVDVSSQEGYKRVRELCLRLRMRVTWLQDQVPQL